MGKWLGGFSMKMNHSGKSRNHDTARWPSRELEGKSEPSEEELIQARPQELEEGPNVPAEDKEPLKGLVQGKMLIL